MRGRLPSGPDYVDHLPGSDLAKDRARTILETLSGQRRTLEACALLDISVSRLYQLRLEMLTAAIVSMEPGQAGRPRHTISSDQARIALLEQHQADMEVELKAAEARAEIAVILPQVVHQCDSSQPPQPEKKTRRRHHPAPGKRKNT
jgi:hypothetical protein